MCYALATTRLCVGLLSSTWLVLHRSTHLGGRVGDIPTKTPFDLYHSEGRYSSSARQPFHVSLTTLGSRAFLPNLVLSVSARSMVSHLFIALVHLLCVLASDSALPWASLSLILLSFLIFQMR